jgi:beta-lactamase class A
VLASSAPPPPAVPLALVAPAEREVSFGRIAGRVPRGHWAVVVRADGRSLAVRHISGGSFDFRVSLPRRDATVRVTAYAAGHRTEQATVLHVFGLPRSAEPRAVRGSRDVRLSHGVRTLARSFPGTTAVYVEDLVSGRGGAWNARARFPAASTLKLAIAIETMRSLAGKPARGSRIERLLRAMLTHSDNQAANDLEVLLGGSTSGGGAHVDALLQAAGLVDSRIYGGYARYPAAVPYVPVTGKYTSARDLARLFALLDLAADGKGLLVTRYRDEFTPSDARFLLYLLGHAVDRRKLGRFLPPGARLFHKAGWVRVARHDSALVYWPGGALVAVVMTYSASGAGDDSDLLAGRIGRAAFDYLTSLRRRPASGP